MPAYTTITNGLVAVGAKPFATTIQALRDNPLAIAEADPTAPVNATAWHPYNKVTNGDSNTGQIWGFTANGAQATVTSPDFADGWDYAFLFQDVNTTAGGGNAFRINLWRETAGAYAGALQIGPLGGGAAIISGWIELPFVRRSLSAQIASWMIGLSTAAPTAGQSGVLCSPSQKILRAQFSYSAGNITGGASSFIYMYRRRSV